MTDTSDKTKRFYGRRQGRPLRSKQAEVINTLLPQLSVAKELLDENGQLDPSSLFPTPYKEYWFEIGFGAGEHLAELMRRHPDTGFLGAEPYVNGMASFLKEINPLLSSRPKQSEVERSDKKNRSLDYARDDNERGRKDIECNVRVHMDDALMLANSLSCACLDGLYVLNPDPWHKTRHHKRRMIRRENLDVFARILKPGAPLITSTDVPYLADWMVTELSLHPAFKWSAKCADDWRTPPDDWITTAYEVKGAKGAAQMTYLFFERT